jgi:predicted Ser/Thr protein kinase
MVEQMTSFCQQCGVRLEGSAVEGVCAGCLLRAGMSSPDDADELQKLFPQLEIFELIGRGGMGSVFRARQRPLDREVALKLLPLELASQPGFAERFAREARALARLNHPHIVTIYDFGYTGGYYFLVMEYVSGLTLRQLMQQRGLKPEEAMALVPQICDALQFAHDEGVVHRDVKPENILLDSQGRVKIADFGLAKLTGRDDASVVLTGSHQVMGTPRYMAPEQIEGSHGVDHRADIYSLGIVFYEMLTGELPMGQFDPPSKVVKVDVRLDEVVLKSIAKAPDRRYQHAGDVKTAVLDLDKAAEFKMAEEYTGSEDMFWALLCLVTPSLAYCGVVWSGTWWPMLALFLPGAGIGSQFPGGPLKPSGVLFVSLMFVLSLAAIGISMQSLESAKPLFGLIAFIIGTVHGSEEEKKKLRKKAGLPPEEEEE